MGVDCLNTLEPPPMGDISLHEACRRVGDKIVLEGNIEKGELYLGKPDEIRAKVQIAIAEGGREGRFILSPTAGVQSWPTCDQTTFTNFIAFIEAGLEHGRY